MAQVIATPATNFSNTWTLPGFAGGTGGAYSTGCDHVSGWWKNWRVTSTPVLDIIPVGAVIDSVYLRVWLGIGDAANSCGTADLAFSVYTHSVDNGASTVHPDAVIEDPLVLTSPSTPYSEYFLPIGGPTPTRAQLGDDLLAVYVECGGPPYELRMNHLALVINYTVPPVKCTTSYERDQFTKVVEPVGPSTFPKVPKPRHRRNP